MFEKLNEQIIKELNQDPILNQLNTQMVKVRKTLGNVKGNFKSAFQKLDTKLQLHRHKVRDFKPNLSFEFERGDYLVKTATNGEDLEACLRLRFEVFHREFMSVEREIGVDVDKLDFVCDHLMIIDRRVENKVIGTYRLNCSKFTNEYYSAGEFELRDLLAGPTAKLELGRACIDKEHRNGVIITLLWRAIAQYLLATESSLLFGCASVKTMDVHETAMMYKYLEKHGHLDLSYGVEPTKKFFFPELRETIKALSLTDEDEKKIQETIPPLFKSYLRMNAKVLGLPALDRDFSCIDFLTVLKVSDLNPLFTKKYKV